MNEIEYTQFKDMKIPSDIKPLSEFKSIQDIKSEIQRQIILEKTIAISLNTQQFRSNEIHIHTADIGATYEPDFDFTDLNEFDAWRKTCKLKYNLQRFKNVDYVRCDGFFHKMQVCESLTLFEEVHRMLKNNGSFLISVFDIFECIKKTSKIQSFDLIELYNSEKKLFSGTDSTGIYYNRTIWTFDRLKFYLIKANFKTVEKTSSEENSILSVIARK
jgi:hypothetical protein